MKRVLLLGATGMLGSAVYDVLKGKYDLVLGVRNPDKIALLDQACGAAGRCRTIVPFDAAAVYQDYLTKRGASNGYFAAFLKSVSKVDFIINAIGVTIPFSLSEPALTFFINGALPHLFAQQFAERFIHITTDCVYNGTEGFPYDERSPKTPMDIYGLSKSLGEPTGCLTIRTSIIGRELNGFTGLLEWFRRQEGQTITGFAEHYWNGITTHQFGRICHQIMESPNGFTRHGVYHVFSTPVSKYEMLLAFQKKYRVPCTIRPDYDQKLNRTLTTCKDLNAKLKIPSFPEMLDALPEQ
ncbi:MAG: sugar nucleotide-binding protein [Acidobacteriia bacterium]|nr:sugar nucleotide-binding protein [Terriglobia bacterium]